MAVTSFKLKAYWRKLERYGPSLTVGGVIASHWSATARQTTKAGQPLANQVLTRHMLPAPWGAWGSG